MTAADRQVLSVMNYLGPMEGTPFVDVEDREKSRIAVDPRQVPFTDARPMTDSLSLDREGFRLVRHRTSMRAADFHDPIRVEQLYLKEMEAVVKAETGADCVVSALGPVVRLNADLPGSVRPASLAHTDYTEFTLRTQIRFQLDLTHERYAGYKRITAYQTWRALSPPPQDNTLALCDARTVSTQDRVLSRFIAIQPQRATLEFYMYRYNPSHRWYYFSDLTIDELLVFKGFEGDGPECPTVLHGGFDNVACPPGGVPRESIETRAFAFFR